MASHSILHLFLIFLKLGCIAFGGPIAHLGIFHREFVDKRSWLDEKTYMDLVSLCQTLPGPASSQVAIAIGMKKQHLLGGIAAITGFILPSLILLIIAAYGLTYFTHALHSSMLDGLKIAVVAVIAQAILMMGQRFCNDIRRVSITILGAVICLYLTHFLGQILVIFLGAILGYFFLNPSQEIVPESEVSTAFFSFRIATIAWVLFFIGLIVPYLLLPFIHLPLLQLFNIFYRTGALVFGGGHVVLPLLQAQLVTPGLIESNLFLEGYGMTQAIPGPLFSFAGFLGTAIRPDALGWVRGLFCTISIYLPSFLLLVGILPWWETYRHRAGLQSLLSGVSAAVVGLLIAAFIQPVFLTTITSLIDVMIALIAFVLLAYFKWPQWGIVGLCVVSRLVL